MIRKKQVAICIFLLLGCILPACAGAPEAQKNEESTPVFPVERYLTATGSGESEAEARRNAMAEMSNIFESKVYTETIADARSAIDEKDHETFEKQFDASIRIISDVQLKGVRIGKTWKDAQTGEYNALAVLDKLQARRVWDAEIETLETAMDAAQTAAKAADNDFRKLQALNEIMRLWLQREVVQSRLRVIGFPSMLEDEAINIRDVARSVALFRGKLAFYVDIGGNLGDLVNSKVGKRLIDSGYSLVNEEQKAGMTVNGELKLTDIDLNNPEVRYVRATVQARLFDRSTGAQLGEIHEDIRKGHINRDEAARMATEAVADITAQKVIEYIGTNPNQADPEENRPSSGFDDLK